ncbi:MAG: TIGR02678 family protein [Myxococcaceae bacterium]
MNTAPSVLERQRLAERATALRHLLAHPLTLSAHWPDLFVVILRHREWLTSWFADHPGWKLSVEPTLGFARLYKVPASSDDTRPARPESRGPFDRRRYTLLCLTLAAFDEVGAQTTLANLARRVEELSREEAELTAFDPTSGPERRAFVDALRLLTELGVLRVRDGDADRYAQTSEGDALFDVQERLLSHLVSAPVPPAFAGAPRRLLQEVWPETEEGQRLRHRHHVVRRLLEDPVLYFRDLDPATFDWLDHGRAYLYRVLEQDAGFTVERRAEGLAAIDPSGVTADTSFPDGGSTLKHATILLAEQLTRLRCKSDRVVTLAEAVTLTRKLHHDFGELCNWSRQYPKDDEGCGRLAFDSLKLLESFGLVRPQGDGWQVRPAIARFRPGTPTRRAKPRASSRSV